MTDTTAPVMKRDAAAIASWIRWSATDANADEQRAQRRAQRRA